MKCEICNKIIVIKEKTIEKKFDKLISYIAKAERNPAFDYFKLCMQSAGKRGVKK